MNVENLLARFDCAIQEREVYLRNAVRDDERGEKAMAAVQAAKDRIREHIEDAKRIGAEDSAARINRDLANPVFFQREIQSMTDIAKAHGMPLKLIHKALMRAIIGPLSHEEKS